MKTKQSRSAGQNKKYYVYIIKCFDQTFYTGITNDLERRVEEHNSSDLGAKYTRGRRPVSLVYFSKNKNRSMATKEECRIKKLSRLEKARLINSYKTQIDI